MARLCASYPYSRQIFVPRQTLKGCSCCFNFVSAAVVPHCTNSVEAVPSQSRGRCSPIHQAMECIGAPDAVHVPSGYLAKSLCCAVLC